MSDVESRNWASVWVGPNDPLPPLSALKCLLGQKMPRRAPAVSRDVLPQDLCGIARQCEALLLWEYDKFVQSCWLSLGDTEMARARRVEPAHCEDALRTVAARLERWFQEFRALLPCALHEAAGRDALTAAIIAGEAVFDVARGVYWRHGHHAAPATTDRDVASFIGNASMSDRPASSTSDIATPVETASGLALIFAQLSELRTTLAPVCDRIEKVRAQLAPLFDAMLAVRASLALDHAASEGHPLGIRTLLHEVREHATPRQSIPSIYDFGGSA